MEALEKELYINLYEKDKDKIIDLFELAMSIQLPVIDNKRVVGILDLFKFLHSLKRPVDIGQIMEQDFTVSGEQKSRFTFSSSNQAILPFVDKEGEYLGYVDRMLQKCYLPSKEYMKVIERKIKGNASDEEFGGMSSDEFDAIIESNYDGIYVTVEEGKTLSINKNCKFISGINDEEISLDPEKEKIVIEENPDKSTVVTVAQNIQKRNEISISSNVIQDGNIIRVIQNLKDFEKMRNEFVEIKKLADKYQIELEFLKWGADRAASEVVAASQAMKQVVNLALKISKVDSTVLILGQSGVGKGVLSKMIHDNSERSSAPFIKIDCGAIPENLLESELFGYEAGAFTGADKNGKIGQIELANGGTLFLDEIGEVPLLLQAKLLRFLQDRQIMRVGGKKMIPIDIRVIAATNRNLEEMVAQKTFRKDLFYRLNVVPIKIPPLCERKEDIVPLIDNLLEKFRSKFNINYKIEPYALKKLVAYDWPGNVRELENTMEFTLITSNSETITVEDLPVQIYARNKKTIIDGIDDIVSLKDAIDELEYNILVNTMKKSKNITEMGDLLRLDRSNVSRKLQKHGIKPEFHIG